MRERFLLQLLVLHLVACGSPPTPQEPEAPAPPSAASSTGSSLGGQYRYLGNGIADVTQDGSKVHMLLTWTPQGGGPHYEVNGELRGNTIEGKWYSHNAKQGWYYFHGEVSPSGLMIDFAKSEDPIGSNMNRVKLMRNE